MAKAIREACGKAIVAKSLKSLLAENAGSSKGITFPVRSVTVTASTDFAELARNNPWLESEVRKKPTASSSGQQQAAASPAPIVAALKSA